MSQYWDFFYVNASPAVQAAPTTDGTANDPDTLGIRGSFVVTDKFYATTGAGTEVVIFAVGGTVTEAEIYIYSHTRKAWVLLHDALAPSVNVPTRSKVPPNSKLCIRIVNPGAATAIYAGYDVA
jgi:hypothetical protein